MVEAVQRSGGHVPAVDLLRVVAITFIVNSHMDEFYPVPVFATGGAIGNALFFALSGFGLAASMRGANLGLAAWYRRRVCRVYPALLLAVVCLIVLPGRRWAVWDFHEWVAQALWPTAYWFVGALMLFYMLLYPFIRIARSEVYLCILLLLVIPYLTWYLTALDLARYTIEGDGHFKWIHYFQVMLFGAYLAGRKDRLTAAAGWRDGVLLVVVLTAYYGLLYLFSTGRGTTWQGVTHLMVYPMILFALRFVCSPAVAGRFLALPGVRTLVPFVAGITLELYLVHGAFRSHPWVKVVSYPLDILVYAVMVLAAAYLLHRAALVLARAVRCSP